jgi:glycosyltransferase involved in cell wall biosynthesis
VIYFDTTKASQTSHHSGIQRVCTKLRTGLAAELGNKLVPVHWSPTTRCWSRADGSSVAPTAADWLLTAELFSEDERPGLSTWLAQPSCRTAAIYYDAIPLKHPHWTWPHSVERHPGYMKLLARFVRVLAISETSRAELAEYWKWGDMAPKTAPTAFPLGADGSGRPRARNRTRPDGPPALLMVGILEPRKNQQLLLSAAEMLWREGLEFSVNLVGRVNPHFGVAIERRVRDLCRRYPSLHYHGPIDDSAVAALATRSLVGVFPSQAEGNGLPVIEALWSGLPCVCSDIPALAEHASGGGCLLLANNDTDAWIAGLRRVITEPHLADTLGRAAINRQLPTWSDSVLAVLATLS